MTTVTTNTLGDIIKFLQNGYFVCIHDDKIYNYYYSKEAISIKDEIKDKKLIYIDVSKNVGLLDKDEWPWYIIKYGFVEYKSISILPVKREYYSL
jgi:hypothetical protein